MIEAGIGRRPPVVRDEEAMGHLVRAHEMIERLFNLGMTRQACEASLRHRARDAALFPTRAGRAFVPERDALCFLNGTASSGLSLPSPELSYLHRTTSAPRILASVYARRALESATGGPLAQVPGFASVRGILGEIAGSEGACNGMSTIVAAARTHIDFHCDGQRPSADRIEDAVREAIWLYTQGYEGRIQLTGVCGLWQACTLSRTRMLEIAVDANFAGNVNLTNLPLMWETRLPRAEVERRNMETLSRVFWGLRAGRPPNLSRDLEASDSNAGFRINHVITPVELVIRETRPPEPAGYAYHLRYYDSADPYVMEEVFFVNQEMTRAEPQHSAGALFQVNHHTRGQPGAGSGAPYPMSF